MYYDKYPPAHIPIKYWAWVIDETGRVRYLIGKTALAYAFKKVLK